MGFGFIETKLPYSWRRCVSNSGIAELLFVVQVRTLDESSCHAFECFYPPPRSTMLLCYIDALLGLETCCRI